MTVTLQELAAASRVIRDAVKDRSYERTPLGLVVRRYLSWKQVETGASPITVSDYERHLAQLCLYLADQTLDDLEPPAGTDTLRDFIVHAWGTVAPATRAKRISVLHDFFDWVVAERFMENDPSRRIRRPSIPDPERDVISQADAAAILRACCRPRDLIAASLVLDVGLRKGELRGVQMGDYIDGNLHVLGKGSRRRIIPIVDPILKLAIEQHQQETNPADYLLHPEHWTNARNRAAGRRRADIVGKILLWSDPSRPLSNTRTHVWWATLLERADVPHKRMHSGRHFALTTLWRATRDLELVRAIAGHRSVTTTQIYVHSTLDDLLEALQRVQTVRSTTNQDRPG